MNNKVFFGVLAALVLAVIAGLATGPEKTLLGVSYLSIYTLIGQLFLNALTLVVIPLVVASIITGMAKMGQHSSFRSLGAKTFGAFILTTSVAVITGWAVAMLIKPGAFMTGYSTGGLSVQGADTLPDLSHISQNGTFETIQLILLKLVPSNIIYVAAEGQLLGLILFSIVFGYFIPKIDSELGSALEKIWKGVFQVMMKMTFLVIKALPIGVFGLVAKVVATTGFATFLPIIYFFFTVLLGLFIYAFIVLPLILKFVARVNPIKHYRAVAPAMLTAFFTSSTAATMPITIRSMEERAGVSNTITSFTIPLASSLNLSGSACYICIAVIFICQAFGCTLTLPLQIFIALMAGMTSMAMGGIPSASLASIILILQSIGLPKEGVVMILAVERILDMFRTSVNVFGNTCCAVIVAKLEGEKNVLP